MSRAARTSRQRRQPYAWLGAGAVTVGLGAAMVGGAAVAFADTGTEATGGADPAATSAATPSARTGAGPSRKQAATRAPRAAAAPRADSAPGAPARKTRVSLPTPDVAPAPDNTPDNTPEATPLTPAAEATPLTPAADAAPPAAAAVATRQRTVRAPRTAAAAGPAATAADATANSAAVADFPPSPPSPFLPAEPIVPGAHVQLALQQISDAQTLLNQETWGAGNVLAGLVSIVPQLFLAQASFSLSAWQGVMPVAQDALAATAGIPIIHQITQVGLLASMTLPSFAGIGLGGASLFLPLVNLLGASIAPAQELVSQARNNGQVYAIVPVQMKATTEPTVNIKINNGASTSMLVDSGSSGLLVTRDSVGSGDLGPAVGVGSVNFSGDPAQAFHYTAYNTTVDFGGAAVTAPTVVYIVDDVDAARFKNFLDPAGVVGILGTGADTYGPTLDGYTDPLPLPTTALPGELGDGVLLYQDVFFGLFGFMVLGPNPLPTRVSVPGAGYASVKVAINDGTKQDVTSIIDSGGVYGTLPQYLIGGGSAIPSGTKISVYSPDGATLLYSYNTSGSNTPTVVPDTDPMNTGYVPFSQGPIYWNYGASGGFGSTDFSIW